MIDARLEVAGAAGRQVAIDRAPFRLGRRSESDLVLPQGEVSRDHAEIVAADSGFTIRDRGSRYGTFINDEAVTERMLADGDRIRLGRTGGAELVFRLRGARPTTVRDAGGGGGTAAAADLRHVAALLEGLRALSSARVLDDVLALVMDSAITVSGAERGFIMLASDEGGLDLKMARARGRKTLPGGGFETSRKIPEEVFRTGRTRIEADLLDGDLADVHVGTVALGIRHVLCVPLHLMRFSDAVSAPAEAAPPAEEEARRIGVLYLDGRDKAKLLSPSTEGALETLANEAAVAIQNAELYRMALENARLEREMQTAARIQQALLPNRQRSGAFFDAAAATLPCRSIGGDFFDYIDRPDGALAFALGDVAGKGPPAALLGALMQGSLAAEGSGGAGPAATMTTVNTALVRRGIQGRFVTLFYAVLYPDGRLIYCNAGHNAPVLVTAGGVERLETGGMVVGLFDGVGFDDGTATLRPGDYLVLFSDGVSEAMNPDGEEYGDDRLLECLTGVTGSECEPCLHAIFASVDRFTAGAAQHDDVTAMVVSYRPRASAAT